MSDLFKCCREKFVLSYVPLLIFIFPNTYVSWELMRFEPAGLESHVLSSYVTQEAEVFTSV